MRSHLGPDATRLTRADQVYDLAITVAVYPEAIERVRSALLEA